MGWHLPELKKKKSWSQNLIHWYEYFNAKQPVANQANTNSIARKGDQHIDPCCFHSMGWDSSRFFDLQDNFNWLPAAAATHENQYLLWTKTGFSCSVNKGIVYRPLQTPNGTVKQYRWLHTQVNMWLKKMKMTASHVVILRGRYDACGLHIQSLGLITMCMQQPPVRVTALVAECTRG